jgi:hypothetical protein
VESGFEVVVEGAQGVEFVEAGVFGLRPGFLVVVFDLSAVAALDRAEGVGPHHRDLLCGGRPAAQVGDVGHVDTIGDDQLDDGIAEQVTSDGYRDGADPGYLAQLFALDLAAAQGCCVDA